MVCNSSHQRALQVVMPEVLILKGSSFSPLSPNPCPWGTTWPFLKLSFPASNTLTVKTDCSLNIWHISDLYMHCIHCKSLHTWEKIHRKFQRVEMYSMCDIHKRGTLQVEGRLLLLASVQTTLKHLAPLCWLMLTWFGSEPKIHSTFTLRQVYVLLLHASMYPIPYTLMLCGYCAALP